MCLKRRCEAVLLNPNPDLVPVDVDILANQLPSEYSKNINQEVFQNKGRPDYAHVAGGQSNNYLIAWLNPLLEQDKSAKSWSWANPGHVSLELASSNERVHDPSSEVGRVPRLSYDPQLVAK